jgi:hypothetical protein
VSALVLFLGEVCFAHLQRGPGVATDSPQTVQYVRDQVPGGRLGGLGIVRRVILGQRGIRQDRAPSPLKRAGIMVSGFQLSDGGSVVASSRSMLLWSMLLMRVIPFHDFACMRIPLLPGCIATGPC